MEFIIDEIILDAIISTSDGSTALHSVLTFGTLISYRDRSGLTDDSMLRPTS